MRQLVPFVILSLWFPSAAHAEGKTNVAAGLGARLGLGWTTAVRAEGSPGELTGDYRGGFSFGLSSYLDVVTSSAVGLGGQLDILFVQKGNILELDGTKYGEDGFHYLDIPLMMRPSLHVLESLRLHATIGPRIGILVGAESIGTNGDVRDVSEFYDRIDVGLSVGAGALVDIGSRAALVLEARYDHGFTNIDDTQENPGIRHRTIFFTLGVDWEIWRKGSDASAAVPQ